MGTNIHIIVSCTDRKRVRVTSKLRLRSVKNNSLEGRAFDWWLRLSTTDTQRVPARTAYAGEHWVACLELCTVARSVGLNPTLWVASAGYGLINEADSIAGYSATFSSGQPDSVARNRDDVLASNRGWWSTLCRLKKTDGRTTSIADVALGDPESVVLFVGSPSYVGAVHSDLSSAAKALKKNQRLLVVTSSAARTGDLQSHVIESSARLLSKFGGSRLGLHARVAAHAIRVGSERGFEAGELAAHFKTLSHRSAPLKEYNRRRMTDEEVVRFIRDEHVRSYSVGLKLLRKNGFACEQKRFRTLFRSMEAR